MMSQESIPILNAAGVDAHIEIIEYCTDRVPFDSHLTTVPVRRDDHRRHHILSNPKRLP